MGLEQEISRLDLRRDTAGPLMQRFSDSTLSQLHRHAPTLWALVEAQAARLGRSVQQVTFSSIEPNQSVAKHVDVGPHYARYHYPVTAPVYWWDEEQGDLILPQGEWSGPLPFWKLHSVSNPTAETRITVIVDFD